MNRPRRETLESSWDWLEFAAQLPARAIPFTSQSASFGPLTGRCIFLGVSWNNAATTAGAIDVLDGQDAKGGIAWQFTVAASVRGNGTIPGQGVLLEIGCWLNLTTVTITGAVLLIPLWHHRLTPPGE